MNLSSNDNIDELRRRARRNERRGMQNERRGMQNERRYMCQGGRGLPQGRERLPTRLPVHVWVAIRCEDRVNGPHAFELLACASGSGITGGHRLLCRARLRCSERQKRTHGENNADGHSG